MISFPSTNGISQGALRYLVNNSLHSSVSLTSSGVISSIFPPTNLLTFQDIYASESLSSFGQWLKMEFVDYKIDLTNYSVLYHSVIGAKMSWKFSISSNGENWTDIHTKSNLNIQTGLMFPSEGNNIRFFKWTCTGPSGDTGQFDRFAFREIDVYGNLYIINFSSSFSLNKSEYRGVYCQTSNSIFMISTILVYFCEILLLLFPFDS